MRDVEAKVRFCGYDPVAYKLFAWTLSAMICGFAGALYVPQVGIINPSEMQTSSSVEIAIWAAVGGRGTLVGPILGAFLVNGGKSWLTAAFPTAWLYVLGTLFVVITLVLPGGLVRAFSGAARGREMMEGWMRDLASKRAASGTSSNVPLPSADLVAPAPTSTVGTTKEPGP
jgi:urea transport system permease protein